MVAFQLHRRFSSLWQALCPGDTSGPEIDDTVLVERIIAAYRATATTVGPRSNSFWDGPLFEMKRDVHDALIASDVVTVQRMLRDPGSTDLFYGFDNLCRSISIGEDEQISSRLQLRQLLTILASALGVRRVTNPEQPKDEELPEAVEILPILDDALGVKIDFPTPFSGEVGIETPRGLASYRAIQALYQAWRIRSLVGPGARVLEIGGGLGRTAYYAHKLGITDYTIIDLPLTSVAQSYFLGRTLGIRTISLLGEDMPGVRVLPPSSFHNGTERYDLVLNVDSLTEMSRETALSYCAAIKERADIFLSINHEANPFTAREVTMASGLPAGSRTPYWMRPGYVEELYRLNIRS